MLVDMVRSLHDLGAGVALRCSSTGMRVLDRRRHVGQKNVCVSGERFLRWFPCVARYLEKGRNRKEKPCQTDEQKTHARWKHVSKFNAFCAYEEGFFLIKWVVK